MPAEQIPLKDGFTWVEKFAMRAGAAAMVAVGAVAIYRGDPRAALAYLAFVAVGGLVVMYDSLCVYCPYPFKHSDCLFFPYPLVASVTTFRTGPIPWFRNALTALVFLGMVAIPQYWLWGQWGLFAAFWLLAVAGGLVIPQRFCRHCRHHRCPVNRVAPSQESRE